MLCVASAISVTLECSVDSFPRYFRPGSSLPHGSRTSCRQPGHLTLCRLPRERLLAMLLRLIDQSGNHFESASRVSRNVFSRLSLGKSRMMGLISQPNPAGTSRVRETASHSTQVPPSRSSKRQKVVSFHRKPWPVPGARACSSGFPALSTSETLVVREILRHFPGPTWE